MEKIEKFCQEVEAKIGRIGIRDTNRPKALTLIRALWKVIEEYQKGSRHEPHWLHDHTICPICLAEAELNKLLEEL